MKNFLSFLLVLIFSVGSFGVVFAEEGDDTPVPEAEAEEVDDSCDNGVPWSVDSDNDGITDGDVCTPCAEFDESTPIYSPDLGGCVSRKESCDAATGKTWDNDKCSDANAKDNLCCIGTKDYCNNQEKGYDSANDDCRDCNPPEEYDNTIKDCHNPNLTPSTLLPDTEYKETTCERLFLAEVNQPDVLKNIVVSGKENTIDGFDPGKGVSRNLSPLDILGCAIKTGRVGLWMIPFYIKYFIQFALSLAGLVAVGSIVIGGYFYLFGALADDKDKGKRAIMYGILGFIVAILSWTIINIVISILTR